MEKYNECVEDWDQYKQLAEEKEKELLIEMEHTQLSNWLPIASEVIHSIALRQTSLIALSYKP